MHRLTCGLDQSPASSLWVSLGDLGSKAGTGCSPESVWLTLLRDWEAGILFLLFSCKKDWREEKQSGIAVIASKADHPNHILPIWLYKYTMKRLCRRPCSTWGKHSLFLACHRATHLIKKAIRLVMHNLTLLTSCLLYEWILHPGGSCSMVIPKWGDVDWAISLYIIFLAFAGRECDVFFPPIIRNLLWSPRSFKAYQSGTAPWWYWPSHYSGVHPSQSPALGCNWLAEVLPDSSSAKDNASLPQVLLPGSGTWESWADLTSKKKSNSFEYLAFFRVLCH